MRVTDHRARFVLVAALGALAAGCSYDFKNPSEQLLAGQASGAVLADRTGSGGLAGFPGVTVSLKGSAFDQLTRPTGRFALLDLPTGHHTVLFRKGTTWALQRDVELGFGRDGQPEGIDLGSVVLRYATALGGSVELPPGNVIARGSVVDEVTGQLVSLAVDGTTGATATFLFPVLNQGRHVFKAALVDSLGGTWRAAPSVAEYLLDGSSELSTVLLAPWSARASAAATGHLRFQVRLVGNTGLVLSGVTASISPDPGGLSPITPAADGSVDVVVPEGLYSVTLSEPALIRLAGRSAAAVSPADALAAWAVVFNDAPGELGPLYLVASGSVARAAVECVASVDCGTGVDCQGRVCVGMVPPPVTGGGVPYCNRCQVGQGTGHPCAGQPSGLGTCTADGWCDPGCGYQCTTDGTAILGFLSPTGC